MTDTRDPHVGAHQDQHAAAPADDGWEWAVVEIFGHRRHVGRAREEERFGTKMLRIDVPVQGDPAAQGWSTHFYGGASLFSYTPTTEAVVMRANTPYAQPALFRRADLEEREAADDAPEDRA